MKTLGRVLALAVAATAMVGSTSEPPSRPVLQRQSPQIMDNTSYSFALSHVLNSVDSVGFNVEVVTSRTTSSSNNRSLATSVWKRVNYYTIPAPVTTRTSAKITNYTASTFTTTPTTLKTSSTTTVTDSVPTTSRMMGYKNKILGSDKPHHKQRHRNRHR